jgi:tetratricopeptide (TPR) repeat protein/tRNA A-37 threonylcarbamoyl transferase component Bud32
VSEGEPKEFSGGGRFAVVRRIGAGGMGVVYEAFDRERQVRVALKTLPQVEARALLRFKEEFRNLADVSHPNLAALYELFSIGDEWFFSMELVDGQDFLEYVRPSSQTGPSPSGAPTLEAVLFLAPGVAGASLSAEGESKLRRALGQIVAGLNALHDAGKMHRDIKPSNVLVTPEGRVVVLDFGLSSGLRAAGFDKGLRSGTVGYMAPEQAAGEPLTTACDWYAVGVMLYQALTGRLPHAGRSQDVLEQKQKTDPPPPSEIAPGAPPDLDELCMALLRRRPEERPSGREILSLLDRGENPTALHPAKAAQARGAPFVGRERHLAVLQAAFAKVQGGRPVTVFVHGRSGAGKSYLLRRFLDSVEESKGAVTLFGRCYEAEWVPYKGLDSLVDALARHLSDLPPLEAVRILPRDAHVLARVFPVLRQIEALEEMPQRDLEIPNQQEMRRRAFRALKDLLARLSDRQPLVLAIDDLQWGDLDSAALLSELLLPPDPPILLLLGVHRSEYADSSPGLARLLAAPAEPQEASDRESLEIEPLTEEESRRLALGLLEPESAETAGLAEAIARESGGVPYFVQELVEYVRGGAELMARPSSDQSISLEQVLMRRVDILPESTRRLLEVIAVSGRPLRQRDVYRAAGLPSADPTALSTLTKGHMVKSTGPSERDRVEPYHDRIREAVVAQLPAETHVRHHRNLAETLEAAGGYDPETLAVHMAGAGESGKAGAYYAAAAAAAAATLAFDRAAKLYRLSLELRPAVGSDGRALKTALGDALANAGRGAEAARVYREAQEGAGADEALELQRRAAHQYCVSGHIDEGRTALRDLLGRFGMRLPESPMAVLLSLLTHRARLRLRGLRFRERSQAEVPSSELHQIDVTWSASTGLSMIDIIAGAAFQTRGFLSALRAGEPSRIARSLAWEVAHCSNDGSPAWPRTRRLIDAARTLAERVGHPHPLGLITMTRGIAEFTRGRWKSAVPLLEEAEAIFRERCTGVAWELDTAHTFALWALIYQGEFAEVSSRTAVLLREAEQLGDLYVRTNLDTYMRPHALLASDDPVAARSCVDSALERWSQEGFHLQHLTALFSETLIDLYDGRGESAWRRLSGRWGAVRGSQMLRIQVIRILMHSFRARSALAAAPFVKDPAPLLAGAEKDAGAIAGEKVEWADPMACVLRAGIAGWAGKHALAADLFARSADGFEAAAMGSYAASARRRRGELAGGADGRRWIDESEEWMRRQGVRNPGRMSRAHVAEVPA